MDTALDGKIAIVTGGGRGLGEVIANDLAARGASVVVNDIGVSVDGHPEDATVAIHVVEKIVANGGAAIADTADVSTYDGAASVVALAVEQFGRLDIVVNNAGTLRVKHTYDMVEDDWDEVMRTHVKHTFAMTRHAGAYWKSEFEAGRSVRGRIVNQIAATGLIGRSDMGSNHAAAKGAIAAFTLVTAQELFPYDVTVNGVCPAAVRTRMADHVGVDLIAPEADSFDRADPGNLAPIVSYLCSDRADWITGQVFRLVGGLLGLYQPWSVIAKAEKDGKWTVGELDVEMRRLFGNYPGSLREEIDPYGRSPVPRRELRKH